ncbi:MAG: hypothetical protein U1A77_23510 [Pirellulales bacterium]
MTSNKNHAEPEPSVAQDCLDGITAEYGKPGEPHYRRVVVDQKGGRITFYRCHQSSRLLALGPDPEFTCGLDEIRGICATWVGRRNMGAMLDVVTPTGRARLPHAMHGFAAIRQVLEQAVARSGNKLNWYEYATAQEALVMACGIAGAAVAIWALLALPGWATAVFVGVLLFLIIAARIVFWRSKRTLW